MTTSLAGHESEAHAKVQRTTGASPYFDAAEAYWDDSVSHSTYSLSILLIVLNGQ